MTSEFDPRKMRFGSVCSGIEAASVAWTDAVGWKAAWFSEIEPFPCELLKQRFPDVPNYGDMTTLPERILSGEIDAPDILCGGTPCVAFSVAGKRLSLADARGNLTLVFCQIADAIETTRTKLRLPPPIIFWENVPGVLHTKDNAFGCFLGELVGSSAALEVDSGRWPSVGFVAGPKRTLAWRTLDAQYFGVPQRRRRVFVVASAREDFDPSEVLFESDSLSGNFETSGSEGQETSRSSASDAQSTSDSERRVALPYSDSLIAPTVTSKWAKGYGGPTTGHECSNMIIEQQVLSLDRASFNQGQNAKFGFSVQAGKAQTLTAKGPGAVLAPTMLDPVAPTLTSGPGERHFSGNQEIFTGKYFVFQQKDDEK